MDKDFIAIKAVESWFSVQDLGSPTILSVVGESIMESGFLVQGFSFFGIPIRSGLLVGEVGGNERMVPLPEGIHPSNFCQYCKQ